MRKSDKERRLHFRASTRLFTRQGQWFFATREGDAGPFPSKKMAEIELARYTDMSQFVHDTEAKSLSGVDAPIVLQLVDETGGAV